MPQIHFVNSRERALKSAREKIFQAPDDASAIVSAHLIIEALLHMTIRSKLPNPKAMEPANLRFHQTLCLTQAMRRNPKSELWLWETLEYLNQIRNRLSHDIYVNDLPSRIDRLYELAGSHIDQEREQRLKFFLLVLCGVVFGLQKTHRPKVKSLPKARSNQL